MVLSVLGASPAGAAKPDKGGTVAATADPGPVELVSPPVPASDGPVMPPPASVLTFAPDEGGSSPDASVSATDGTSSFSAAEALTDVALPSTAPVSAPGTPSRLITGEHLDVAVTVTNVTTAAWGAAQELRADWLLPDGTPAPAGKAATTLLPDLAPGASAPVLIWNELRGQNLGL